MKAVIATSKCPADFEAYLEGIKEWAADSNVVIQGYVVTDGPGCCNHGIMLEGDNSEQFMNQLTMALMPSRWSAVADSDPAIEAGQFDMQVVL